MTGLGIWWNFEGLAQEQYIDNDNDKVFYSTFIIYFILHITVTDAFAY